MPPISRRVPPGSYLLSAHRLPARIQVTIQNAFISFGSIAPVLPMRRLCFSSAMPSDGSDRHQKAVIFRGVQPCLKNGPLE